jgi:rod shape-determining protein MreD
MTNPYSAAVLLVVVALAQTSFWPGLGLGIAAPDLMLLVTVAWSLLRGPGPALSIGLVGGVLLDLLSGGPFGAVVLSLVPASALTGLLQHGVSRESPWLPLVAGTISTLLYHGLYILILRLLAWPVPGIALGLVEWLLPCLIWNALLMYPVYAALRRLHLRSAYGRAG